MSADKLKKIDYEVKEIHVQIKKTNLNLRKRIKDILEDMEDWDCLGGLKDDKRKSKGYLR